MATKPDSKWYTSSAGERWSKPITITLPVEIINDLDALDGVLGSGGRSGTVRALIDGEMDRRGLPRATPPKKKSTVPKKNARRA
jgi:hypothetical protein